MNGSKETSEPLHRHLEVYHLLPKHTDKYFRYEGSLTTPNCGEAVIWTVFTESLHVHIDQVHKMKSLIPTESGKSLTHNYRTLQPLNSRVLAYISPDNIRMLGDDNSSGNSNNVKYNSFGIVFMTIICIFNMLLKSF